MICHNVSYYKYILINRSDKCVYAWMCVCLCECTMNWTKQCWAKNWILWIWWLFLVNILVVIQAIMAYHIIIPLEWIDDSERTIYGLMRMSTFLSNREIETNQHLLNPFYFRPHREHQTRIMHEWCQAQIRKAIYARIYVEIEI